jgi:hypothetical protein
VTCNLCGSKTLTLVDPNLKIKDRKLRYHRCTQCGFTKKEDAALIDSSSEKAQYDFHENHIENEGYKNLLQGFIDDTVTPFKASGSLLEYGAGPGPVLGKLLSDMGFEVTLYDPYYHVDKEALKKRYDVITSTEVFEHFYEPLKTIKTLVNCLNSNGILAIQTSFKTMDDETFLTWWYRRDLTHVSFYTLESFKVISDLVSCEIIYTNHTNRIVLRKK